MNDCRKIGTCCALSLIRVSSSSSSYFSFCFVLFGFDFCFVFHLTFSIYLSLVRESAKHAQTEFTATKL